MARYTCYSQVLSWRVPRKVGGTKTPKGRSREAEDRRAAGRSLSVARGA